MEPTVNTPDIFIIKPSYKSQPEPVRSHYNKKKRSQQARKVNRQLKHVAEPEPILEMMETGNVEPILKQQTIYIDKNVCQQSQLEQMAEAMGATVKDKLDQSVTVFIVEPRQLKSLSSVNNVYIKSSPKWITTCFKERHYFSPILFPCDMKENQNTLQQENRINDDYFDNPFGEESVDYDLMEETRPGKQLKLDKFVVTMNSCGTSTVSEQASSEQAPLEQASEQTTQASFQQMYTEEEDDQEAMNSEFYYNCRANETIQEFEARKKKSLERSLALQEQIKNYSKLNKQEASSGSSSDISSKKQRDNGIYSSTKLKIWYGEQKFLDLNPSTKRAVRGTTNMLKRAR